MRKILFGLFVCIIGGLSLQAREYTTATQYGEYTTFETDFVWRDTLKFTTKISRGNMTQNAYYNELCYGDDNRFGRLNWNYDNLNYYADDTKYLFVGWKSPGVGGYYYYLDVATNEIDRLEADFRIYPNSDDTYDLTTKSSLWYGYDYAFGPIGKVSTNITTSTCQACITYEGEPREYWSSLDDPLRHIGIGYRPILFARILVKLPRTYRLIPIFSG